MKPLTALPCSMHPGRIEAGVDEAGRGCLAGPVYAAAVILPAGFTHPMLNDSKKLSEKQRYSLREVIEKEAVAWAIGICTAEEIDKSNILNASIEAMHRALRALHTQPEVIVVDGNRFKPYQDIEHHTVVKGDGKYADIAAASILAKTYRDDFMKEIASGYPQYGWEINKGYPTRDHRAAIAANGPTPFHRMSFRLLSTQLTLDL